MPRRISNSSQSSAGRTVSRTTGASTRGQTISGLREGAEPLSHVPYRHHRESPINFFTIAEVAEHLQVSGRTVRRWIEAGHLAVHRVGGIVRIAEADLRAFLAIHREG
jgi:excisionase family DNA binding protein